MKRQTYLFYTVQYGSVGRKWAFKWPGNNILFAACKGKPMADKIASIIAGSLKRSGNTLDNLARANIRDLINRNNEQE